MSAQIDEDKVNAVYDRMGEAGWLVAGALAVQTEPVPGIEIMSQVNATLERVGLRKRLTASTLHHAFKRLQADDVICRAGRAEVEVPGPWGSRQTEVRTIYGLTDFGLELLKRQHNITSGLEVEAERRRKGGLTLKRLIPEGDVR